MNTKDLKNIAVLSAIGIALYLALRVGKVASDVIEATGEAVQKTADFISAPIARIISALTLPGKLHVAGGVVFSNGSYVSWDAITDAGSRLDVNMQFTWNARRYRVVKRRPDGNYDAVPV